MRLINRTSTDIQYAVYDASDTMAALGVGVHRLGAGGSGGLKANETCELNGTGGVQIEIIVGEPLKGLFILPPRAIRASRDKIYTYDVVYTGDKLVQLDAEYRELVGLNDVVAANLNKPDAPDITKIARAVLTVADAIFTTAWGDTWNEKTTKWMPAGALKAALALVDIFGTTPGTMPLSVSDIQVAVQQIIDTNEARKGVGDVMTVNDWLNKYVSKSRYLAEKSPDLSTVELSDYDRQAFVTELKDIQGGRTAFRKTMDTYRNNRDIRKYAIPTYLLGMLLHMHIEILALVVKQETTPVDAADIEAVVKLAKDYRATLPQLEEDYVLFCNDLYQKYPLVFKLSDVGRTDTEIYQIPTPTEGIALGMAAVAKYLQGDRMIIETNGTKLNHIIQHVPKL
jgi:hypothetical protein